MDGTRAGGGRGPFADPPAPSPGPSDASAALARLVEAEILPRLMLAHRAPPARPAGAPGAGAVARVEALLLDPGPFDPDRAAADLLDGGARLGSLLLDVLAPAARRLGALWEDDACDFLAVTEGLGRLHAITRRLCARLEGAGPPRGRSVLLAPCPGETHAYGLSVVASFFREAGWSVTLLGRDDDALAAVRAGWFDAVGLSLSCDVLLPALRAAVPALRRASGNPDVAVIVGGPWFRRAGAWGTEPRGADLCGADACAVDARAAPGLAEALLARLAVAC